MEGGMIVFMRITRRVVAIHTVRRVALQHRDRQVTKDYCDISSLYVFSVASCVMPNSHCRRRRDLLNRRQSAGILNSQNNKTDARRLPTVADLIRTADDATKLRGFDAKS